MSESEDMEKLVKTAYRLSIVAVIVSTIGSARHIYRKMSYLWPKIHAPSEVYAVAK